MLKLYNSLTRKIEDFKPIHPLQVGMYTCGPTVYDFAHIGNFRTYTSADLLLRTLTYNDFEVDYIMNLTDVGHLTGDNLGDADLGEDRMEKSARREGKTAWEIAKFYTDAFLQDFEALNLIQPRFFAKATEHIKEQIALVSRLEDKGYTYHTSDGIYFDTSKYKDYGTLSNLDQIKEGARVEINPEKKNPRDFALWKFSYPNGISRSAAGEARQMEWDSPWGVGFPGWHIECSAMAMKYLGESFDIHVGGIDLRETHHPNEIAQSEAATGKKFVNFWMHGAFMLVKGERMSKSLGNNYKMYDLEKEGFDALTLRYLYLQTHYRQEMNFTFASLEAAQTALAKLREAIIRWDLSEPAIDFRSNSETKDFEKRFLDAINDDLNMSQALAVVWELTKSFLPDSVKRQMLLKFDEVLGLNLKNAQLIHDKNEPFEIPEEIEKLAKQRDELRRNREYKAADVIREKVARLGYDIDDTEDGTKIKKLRK